ncbi:MAG: hypothetical protein WBE92_09405 [Steroidobacteraceae bacterium]
MSAPDSVDADNPWLGLASFTEETRAYFFGREGEVAELTRRVQRQLLTVLFGKSGLGKTSILRAGLVPRLRAQGYFPVYLRIDYGHDSPEPAEQIKQAINRAARNLGDTDVGAAGGAEREAGKSATAAEWTQSGVAVAGESIWEFLHRRDDVRQDVSAETLVPLLIFDQFEELFTLAQSDEFGRARAARFIEELADLVENRPPKALEARLETDESIAERFDFSRSDYRVVIALREDYLAPLESLKRTMPSLSQNRLRLAPMTGSQALEAVLEPANRLRPGKHLVSEEVAEAIVRFVAGGSELANAEVEPSLLSLICRELNEQRIAQGRSEISQDLLAGSHEMILSNFYERSLADQPESVRRIVEDDLLTESGYRENLAEESLLKRFQVDGAAPDALAKLVNRRLLRIEERLDVRRVELTHDVLTSVVKASRDQRHEREAREATERMLAEQRERENAARRSLRRAQAVAAGCTLLALVAIALAVLAVFSVQHARRAERVAQQTRAVSEQARRQAEGLLGFLTDSFVSELETFGRYQTIAELSQREIDYFQRLPAQLKDPETIRSGALALVNHTEALQYLGDPLTGARNAADAVTLLESLRATDRSEATSVALGRAYAKLGWTLAGAAKYAEGRIDLQRAVGLLRPPAERAGAPVEARGAYLEALAKLGWVDNERGQDNEAMRVEREALRVGALLRAARHGDVTVDANYAFAGAELGRALLGLGRTEDARQAGKDALTVADQVVAQRPQYGWGLFGQDWAEVMLTATALDELDPAEALRLAMQQTQTALAMVAIEPNDTLYVNELGIAYTYIGNSMWTAGRLREAVGYSRKGMATFGQAGASGVPIGNLLGAVDRTLRRQALLGDSAGVAATLSAADAFLSPSALRKLGPMGDTVRRVVPVLQAHSAAALAYDHDDFGGARRIAHSALAAFQAHGGHDGYLSEIEGRAEYALGDFAAAEQAERMVLQGAKASASNEINDQRDVAQPAIWLSMALAREGKRAEAAGTIGPVVQMYRGLEKMNRGDQWLPLELAEALYAQALTDAAHRPGLLREAAQRVDHLLPPIAALHDTRQWRAWIEAAQRTSSGEADR